MQSTYHHAWQRAHPEIEVTWRGGKILTARPCHPSAGQACELLSLFVSSLSVSVFVYSPAKGDTTL